MTDAAILEACRAGETQGLEALYAAHAPGVRAYLIRLVGADAADDLTHEVFLRAAAHVGKFRGESTLGWWLNRIATNCAARHVTRSRRQVPVAEIEAEAPRSGPEQLALDAEDRREAGVALERLDGADRQILMLREVSGLSYEEIRDRLKLKVGTVKSRLHKAREALRRAWSRGR